MPGNFTAASHGERFVIAALLAAAVSGTAIGGFFWRGAVGDFDMFYDSGTAIRTGAPLYTSGTLNLNPPIVVRAIFAPLSRLPYQVAKVLWTVAGVLSLLASVRVITQSLHFSRTQRRWLLVAVLSSDPAWGVWFQGQINWLLLYPLTCAWRAYRIGRDWQTGLWLAPLIAVKPQYALVALLLPWRVWVTAGVASAGVTALGVVWTGLAPWLAWWALGGKVHWLAFPENASLWGAAARVQTGALLGGALSDLPRWSVGMLVLVGLLLAWRIVTVRDRDGRFAAAALWMILMTPLGWVHYLVSVAGPVAARWETVRRSPAIWLLWVPLPLLLSLLIDAPLAAISLGSLYTVGLIAGLATLLSPAADLHSP
jgi:hypothetical protein